MKCILCQKNFLFVKNYLAIKPFLIVVLYLPKKVTIAYLLLVTTFLRPTAFPSVQIQFIIIQNENNNNDRVIYEMYIMSKELPFCK